MPATLAPRRTYHDILRDMVHEGSVFVGSRSRFMYLYHRVLCRAKRRRLPMRGRAVALRAAGITDPIMARLGTSDVSVVLEIIQNHEYKLALDHLRAAMPRPDAEPFILDLGANIGVSIRVWLARFPRARIVAVEPDAANLALAERNAAAAGGGTGGASRVRFVQACVAGSDRNVRLERTGGVEQSWAFRMAEGGAAIGGTGQDAETIPAVSVPTLLKEAGITGEIDLLKCDIEGAEREVFETCGPWIGRVRAMVVEVHAPYRLDDLRGHLAAAGAVFDGVTVIKSLPDVEVVMLTRGPAGAGTAGAQPGT